jgi:5'-methylthioadenosine phosphorylase
MNGTALADIGVFGGSGFYSFLDDVEEVAVDTPWGPPSAPLHVGTVQGRRVAFLPRHGVHHEHPAHRINYRANVWAMRDAGVRAIVAPCAAGSLQPDIAPGDFVVCDQLVDRTSGRADTFFDGPGPNHVSFADPYCEPLGAAVTGTARQLGINVHQGGTVVVIQGPRFSTRAESAWYRAEGWHVINMTQYPEAVLARELGLCYATVALVTDHDAGLEGVDGIEPVCQEQVLRVFEANVARVRELLFASVARLPAVLDCSHHDGRERAEPALPLDGHTGR